MLKMYYEDDKGASPDREWNPLPLTLEAKVNHYTGTLFDNLKVLNHTLIMCQQMCHETCLH